MRRTVNVSFKPRPRRPITTPEKIWMRSLSPSTTLVWTRTESPTLKSVLSLRNCSPSILSSNAWFINQFSVSSFQFSVPEHLKLKTSPAAEQIRPSFLRALPRLFHPPLRNLRVVAGDQHVGNFHSAKFRRTRPLRIFESDAGAEGFLLRTLVVAQHAGQQPHYRGDPHHRRQRAVRQHVIADRQLIIGQLLANPLVEPLV